MHSIICRLLVTQYPHLCNVEDWLIDLLEKGTEASNVSPMSDTSCSVDSLSQGQWQIYRYFHWIITYPEYSLI